MKIAIVFSAAVALGGVALDALYTRSIKLPAVRASYSTLQGTIDKARKLARSANAGIDSKSAIEYLTVKGGGAELSLRGEFTLADLEKAPNVASEFIYHLEVRSAPISEVYLLLTDDIRKVTVSGTSEEHVEALVNALRLDVSAASTILGGDRFRLVGGLLLLGLGMLLPGLSAVATTAQLRRAMLAGGPLVSLAVWLFPWQNWFPGVAIYRGEASFLVRHGPLISLAGLLVTILTFVLSLVFSAYLARQPASTEPPAAPGPQSGGEK